MDIDRGMVEELRESITDNRAAQAFVHVYAQEALEFAEASFGRIQNMALRDEVLCQYQNQAWNALFLAIARGQ